jgi:hypothetical protein
MPGKYLTIRKKSILSQHPNGTREEAYSMTFRKILGLNVEGLTNLSAASAGLRPRPPLMIEI